MGKLNTRIVILLIAVIVVGLFAMPTTLSLFSGQHTFKNATEAASDDSCRKCHEDVYEEYHSSANGVHWKRTALTPDAQFECRECHDVTNISAKYISNTNIRADAHAATTVSCLACHSAAAGGSFLTNPMHVLAKKTQYGVWDNGDCGQCHLDAASPGPYPDAFIILVNSTITGSNEAHTEFYYQSKYPENQTDIALKEANTACIGCHTHSGINITWVRSVGYNLSADLTTGNWNMSFSLNQTTVNTTSAGN